MRMRSRRSTTPTKSPVSHSLKRCCGKASHFPLEKLDKNLDYFALDFSILQILLKEALLKLIVEVVVKEADFLVSNALCRIPPYHL